MSAIAGLTSAARLGLALGIGSAGGFVFFRLGIPLPFLLGAMFFCLAAALAGVPVRSPSSMRRVFATVLGAMLGAGFSAELLHSAGQWMVTMLSLVPFLLLSAAGAIFYFRRVAGYDFRTAYFAGMPGGIVEMTMMAHDMGADERRVALCHALRILLIVSTVPWVVQVFSGADLSGSPPGRPSMGEVSLSSYLWIAFSCAIGFIISARVRLPAGPVLVPMLLSAILHVTGVTDFQVPGEIVILAQIVLGVSLGAGFAGARLRELLGVVPSILGAVAVMLAITCAFALGLGWLTGFDPLIILLSYSPGGLTEMGLVALVLGVDPAIVAAHHIARVGLVSIGAATLARLTL